MASRSVRRRRHHEDAWLASLSKGQREVVGRYESRRWIREMRARVASLGEPAVWELLRAVRGHALKIDPTGELHEGLRCTAVDLLATQIGRHLAHGSRPLADRMRVRHVARPAPACI